jgi:hypothetical protein
MTDIKLLIAAAAAAAAAALALHSESDSDSSNDDGGNDSLEEDSLDSDDSSHCELELKRQRPRTLDRETALNSCFNIRYLFPPLANPDPNSPDSVWNDGSVLGRKFRF